MSNTLALLLQLIPWKNLSFVIYLYSVWHILPEEIILYVTSSANALFSIWVDRLNVPSEPRPEAYTQVFISPLDTQLIVMLCNDFVENFRSIFSGLEN